MKDRFVQKLESLQEHILGLEGELDGVTGNGENGGGSIKNAFQELSTALEELRVAEEELREQNETLVLSQLLVEEERARYRDLFEFAPDGYLVTDVRGTIREANRAAAELFGIEEYFLVGKPFPSYLDSDTRRDFKRKLEQLDARDPLDGWEVRLRTRTEQEPVVLLKVGSIVKDGQRVGLRWLLRDISERVTMEEALRASEARFSQAFRAGPVAAVLVTPEGLLADVNRSFETITGYSRDEALGRSADELGLWGSPADLEKLAAGDVAGDYGSSHDLELQVRTKGGDVRDVLASAAPIQLDGGEGRLHMFYDITGRKRTEEELMQAIQVVMTDTAWFSRSVMEKLAQLRAGNTDMAEVAELTPREREVLERIATGASNDDIGAALGIARQTVRNYISVVYDKIGVRSRAEAVVWARERGLVGL